SRWMCITSRWHCTTQHLAADPRDMLARYWPGSPLSHLPPASPLRALTAVYAALCSHMLWAGCAWMPSELPATLKSNQYLLNYHAPNISFTLWPPCRREEGRREA
ncbi:hypothetical protein JOQ06_023320, partial [Pogonophryne albipinna]